MEFWGKLFLKRLACNLKNSEGAFFREKQSENVADQMKAEKIYFVTSNFLVKQKIEKADDENRKNKNVKKLSNCLHLQV